MKTCRYLVEIEMPEGDRLPIEILQGVIEYYGNGGWKTKIEYLKDE